jgi:cytidyltransferase-like protein
MYPEGSAHGRFQPLHNGHLKYLLEAKKNCDFLWVGITQYNTYSLNSSPIDPHRQEIINNPLTFHERLLIVRKALLDNNISSDKFSVIPFPIDTPEYLANYLPNSVPIFTVVCDEWNLHKNRILENLGYKVIVLWEDHNRDIIETKIREEIRLGLESWKTQVPNATREAIEKYGIDKRIQKIQ